MIEAGVLVFAMLCSGATGGVATAALLRRRARGRAVVALEVGQRIAEPDGREWQIVGRAHDAQVGRVPTLRVDLGLRRDPS